MAGTSIEAYFLFRDELLFFEADFFLGELLLEADFFLGALFLGADFFFGALFFGALFFGALFFAGLFFEADFFFGTLPPAFRASDNPMAMACFLLVTFLPLRPLFS